MLRIKKSHIAPPCSTANFPEPQYFYFYNYRINIKATAVRLEAHLVVRLQNAYKTVQNRYKNGIKIVLAIISPVHLKI